MSSAEVKQAAGRKFQDHYNAEIVKLSKSSGMPIAILANAAFLSSQVAQMVAVVAGPGGLEAGSIEARAADSIGECLTSIVVSFSTGFSEPDLKLAMEWVDQMSATQQSVFEALSATSQ